MCAEIPACEMTGYCLASRPRLAAGGAWWALLQEGLRMLLNEGLESVDALADG
jgi:hypothetical protein